MTQEEYEAKMSALGPLTDEQQKSITCSRLGHSHIITGFFGHVYCAVGTIRNWIGKVRSWLQTRFPIRKKGGRSMIEFVENGPWTGMNPCLAATYAPIFMRKNGVEYFVINQVLNESDTPLERIKDFLIQNDGKYFKLNGIYDDPFEMLKVTAERGFTFDYDEMLMAFSGGMNNGLFSDYRGLPGYGAGFVDFCCSWREAVGGFGYRIYDEKMLDELKKAVVPFIV